MDQQQYEERVKKGQEKGWVYIIESDPKGPVKIGWAKDPSKRLKTLQTGHPGELRLIAVIPATMHLEYHFHRQLRSYGIGGEWFHRGRAMRMLRPIVEEFGIWLRAEITESRNSPRDRRLGRRPNVQYVIDIKK